MNSSMNSAHICRWPICKGPAGLHAFPIESARRRRRACLTHSVRYPVRSHKRTLYRVDLLHGRPSTSAAAAAPATPGSGPTPAQRAETIDNESPSSSPPFHSPPQHPTQPQAQQSQQPHPGRRGKPRFRLLPEDLDDRPRPEDNPSLDDIVLDEQYYREMGLTKAEVWEALRQLDATELDPEGVNLGPGVLPPAMPPPATAALRNHRTNPQTRLQTGRAERRLGHLQLNQQLDLESVKDADADAGRAEGMDDDEEEGGYYDNEEEEEGGYYDNDDDEEGELAALLEDEEEDEEEVTGDGQRLLSPFGAPGWEDEESAGAEEAAQQQEDEVYGPEAVVLAGFRPEEHGVVRALLDSAGGQVVKVLPVTEAMLYGTVDEAVHAAEQDWAAPRALDGPRGGGWGAQRTVMFSGLSLRAQLTVLELMESSGIPAVCATTAEGDQAGRRLGEVLAEAVASQRSQANLLPKRDDPWHAAAAAAGGRIADVRRGLTPLEDLIGDKAQERLLQPQDNDDDNGNDGSGWGNATSANPGFSGGVGSSGSGAAAAVKRGPGLTSFGLKAAEAAASEWEAWRSTQAAAAASGWGLDMDLDGGAGPARGPASDPSPDLSLDPHPAEGPDLVDLVDFGVDLEHLRKQVLQQLSEVDPDTLDELLVDSPYGDAASEAVAQWHRVQEEDSGGRSPVAAAAMEPSAAAGVGLTVDDVGRLAARQRRRWQEAQESLESAAAAAGRLVLSAESSLLEELGQATASSPPPSPSPPLQDHQPSPAAASGPSEMPPLPASVSSASAATATAGCLVSAPAVAAAAAAAAHATTATVAAAAATFPAAKLRPAAEAASGSAGNFDSQIGPVQQWRQPSSPPQRQPSSAARSPLQQAEAPQPLPPPLPPLTAFNFFGDSGPASFSELDDLLAQVSPSGVAEAVSGGPAAAGGTSASAAASFNPPDLYENHPGASGSGGVEGSAAAAGGSVSGAAASAVGAVGRSVLQQVREAARSGAPSVEIQRLLDERYGVASPLPSPARPARPQPAATAAAPLTPPATGPPVGAPKRRRGSLFAGLKVAKAAAAPPAPEAAAATAAAAPQRPRRPYGPAPPPKPDPVMKPLLELRPDIAKAMQEKKVQFMDLSRLNDKQKRQFVEYQARQRSQQQVEQQQQEQEQQLEEQQQRQGQQQGRQQQFRQQQQLQGDREEWLRQQAGLTWQAAAKAQQVRRESPFEPFNPGHEYDDAYDVKEDEYDIEGGEEEDEEEEEEQDGELDGEDNEAYGTSMDAEKLQQLMEASEQEGLDLEDTLAQAVAMGVRLPEEVLRRAGVSPPSEAALARAREEYDRMFMEWATEEGLAASSPPSSSGSASVSGGGDNTPSREGVEERRQGERTAQRQKAGGSSRMTHSPDGTEFPATAIPGSGRTRQAEARGTLTAFDQDFGARSTSGKSRPWGAGLTARRQRQQPTGAG